MVPGEGEELQTAPRESPAAQEKTNNNKKKNALWGSIEFNMKPLTGGFPQCSYELMLSPSSEPDVVFISFGTRAQTFALLHHIRE